MANTKTFADMKKPVRQPTPEQIAAFEETGRVSTPAKAASQKPANTEIRASVSTESHERVDTETHIPAKLEIREHGNGPLQNSLDTDAQIPVNAETRKPTNTETRIPAPIVRLTIDLPESDHTRFKTACAMTKRKMVDEVRTFIERRTTELEREAGRVQ